MLPASAANIIGKRYLLHELLGQGGMGSVHRATDRLTGQLVALKQVSSAPEAVEFSSSYDITDFRLALAQEFKLSASLRHPNIIEVLDYGFYTAANGENSEPHPFFTMELLESSKTILEAGSGKSIAARNGLLIQTLQALAYLHRRGILHRDLKPANVLVINRDGEDSAVKVLDFGLSVMRERVSHDEADALTVGTLAYMPPEVLMGFHASEASDLYAVGVMAYELFAGRHPFDVGEVGSLVNQILYVAPAVDSIDVSRSLAMVLQRLLQKSPEARFGSANEVIAALNAASDRPLPIETAATRESFLQAARLVGRDEELEELSSALLKATSGHGSVWLIAGENGVGKSRLVDELRTLALVQGALVMRGQSINEGRSPYHMWRPILRWLCLMTDLTDFEAGLLKSILPDIDNLIRRAVPEVNISRIDPETTQGHILKTLDKMLRSEKQPVVMIFEDLHWAGSESLTALLQLSKHVHDLPIMVIATYRDDEHPDLPKSLPGIPVMKLNRLRDNAIAELSAAMLGEAGKRPQVVNLLQRETEGNVFFVIEVVRALAEEAGHLDEIGRMTLPEHVFAGGVRRIIQRRLSRIPPEDHVVLQVAAVIGRQLDLNLLKIIEPSRNLDLWLTDCANAAVFDVQDGQWRFAHDRLREGVLESLSTKERRALHGRVARAIEEFYGNSPEYTVALAHHWAGAGDVTKEEHYTWLAGRQVLRSGAYREAIDLFERALTLIDRAMRKKPKDRDLSKKQVELKLRLGEARLGLGEYQDARSIYRECLLLCEELDDARGMAEALGHLGDVEYALGDYQRARQLYEESRATSDRVRDLPAVVRALSNLGNVAYELGELDRANELYQQSLTLSREIGGQWGMAGSLGHANDRVADQTEYAQAKKLILDTLTLYEQVNNKRGMADSLFNLGIAAFDMGNHEEARDYFLRSLEIRQELGDSFGTTQSYDRLGAVAYGMGAYEEARKYFLAALKLAVELKMIPLSLYVLLGLAKLLIKDDAKGRALELLTFILYHPESQEKMQDEAERLVFELEDGLPAQVVESAWDKGKNRKFDDVVSELLLESAG